MVTTSQTIPWRHLLLEGAAIVAGILLAFAIDAWWQNREQEAMDHAQLAAVLEELETNKKLLAEALAAHRSTVDEGRLLLELIAGDRSEAVDSRILQLMPRFLNFYEINVPFGALGTASQSGAIARMHRTSLATGLASWPAAIEDLLEEQRAGDDALTALLSFMTAAMPMNEILRGTLASPTQRGVDETVTGIAGRLPNSPHPVNIDAIYSDPAFENHVLLMMIFGQVSYNEALLFHKVLADLSEQLANCVRQHDC